jgi:hypothetical protein
MNFEHDTTVIYWILNVSIQHFNKHIISILEESTKENIGKTKVDRIRIQQIRESCDIQPTNEWMEREEENGPNM